jgi:large subunit ribosomal protein L10
MSKTVKAIIEKELKSRFEGVSECLVVSIRGLKGDENNELRNDLLKQKISLNVVKNSLASRAFGELGMESMRELLSGPCAVVFGGDSIVDVAKSLVEWSKKLDQLEVKGSYLDGKVLDGKATISLSKMPNRRELSGIIVRQFLSPGSKVSGAIISPASAIAGCIKTLIDNKSSESEAA